MYECSSYKLRYKEKGIFLLPFIWSQRHLLILICVIPVNSCNCLTLKYEKGLDVHTWSTLIYLRYTLMTSTPTRHRQHTLNLYISDVADIPPLKTMGNICHGRYHCLFLSIHHSNTVCLIHHHGWYWMYFIFFNLCWGVILLHFYLGKDNMNFATNVVFSDTDSTATWHCMLPISMQWTWSNHHR